MSLTDDVKVALRVSTDALDAEVSAVVQAAIADMRRVGVPEKMLTEGTIDPYVKLAVILFSKANFGYDNSEASRFQSSYRQIVRDILNSPTKYGGDSDAVG